MNNEPLSFNIKLIPDEPYKFELVFSKELSEDSILSMKSTL